jgi:predicted ArsR family transcriptional regulator
LTYCEMRRETIYFRWRDGVAMNKTKLGQKFFESTRGRIVSLLRGSAGTVNELAEELGLTDNAVRAHLLTLERDGLVRQSGIQRGHRKPHFAYELMPEAEHLFTKSYDTLLNQLVGVLKGRLSPRVLKEVLREVGRSLAAREAPKRGGLEHRTQSALKVLEAMGGAPKVEVDEGKLIIRSESCPLAAAVAEHPEVCQVAQALVAEIVGAPVKERCDRNGSSPRCRFEINRTT